MSPPRASAVPAAPLVFVAGPHPLATPLFMRWRSLTTFRSRLQAGGASATAAAQEMRRLSSVDLNGGPAWLHWLELGAWLDDPRGRWADKHPANATLATLQRALLFSATWQTQTPSGRVLTAMLDSTLYAPRDAPGWLTLGCLLEDEGASLQAINAYREGLEVLGRDTIASEAPVLVWRGLARALDTVPGYSLEHGWRRYLPPGMAHRRPWRGLQLATRADERRTARLMMQAAVDRETLAASAVLGSDFELYDQNPEAARQHWEGLLVLRSNFEVAVALHEHWLTRGHLAHPRDPFPGDTTDLLGGPARDLSQLPARSLKDPRRPARLVRYLEARDLTLAREEGEKLVHAGVLAPGALPGELARAGDVSPVNDRACRAVVDRPDTSWAELDRMAGSLASPVDGAWFASRMTSGAPRRVGACAQLAVALWHSRSGRHAEALGLLEPLAGAPHVVAEHAEALTEIYARPLWQRLRDIEPAAAVLARLPPGTRAPASIQRRSAELWRALVASERGRALIAAKDGFDAQPRSLSTLLAFAYAAAADPDVTAARTTLAQIRAAARYQALPLWVLDEIERAERTIGR